MSHNLTPKERAIIAIEELRKQPIDILFQALILNALTKAKDWNTIIINLEPIINGEIYTCQAQIKYLKK